MLLHELKQVQLQKCFMLVTHDSIGHLKTRCMSFYHRAVALSLNGNAAAHRSALTKKKKNAWLSRMNPA